MSEMIDRVAKAIVKAWDDYPSREYDTSGIPKIIKDWDDLTELSRGLARAEARAAIEAMRNPTPEMLEAVRRASYAPLAADPLPYAEVWRAAINEALK